MFVKPGLIVTLLLAAALPFTAHAAPKRKPVRAVGAIVPALPPKPKLIVALAVDQLSSDLYIQYRSRFTGGFKRLDRGAVFVRGHQSHAATETCPGHSTILTGSRPARTGIIANDWQNPQLQRKDKDGKPTFDVYCVEKPGPVGSVSVPYVVTSDTLKVPTLGDRMKAVTPATRVVSVSGKDRAAVMMGGHKTDLTLWWDGKQFTTYKGREADVPASVAAINARATTLIATASQTALPPQCIDHARTVALNDKVSVGTLQPRKVGDASVWRTSPQFDAITLDTALAAMRAHNLGRNGATDVLAISFSGTDYVGHMFGTEGAEMCTQMNRLDATLGRLFANLDATGISYVVALTADHGGADAAERNQQNGLPAAQRADIRLSALAAGAAIGKQMGLVGSALIGRSTFGDMYLAPSVPAEKRAEALAVAIGYYKAQKQVAAVFTADELKAAPAPTGEVDEWSLLERAKASFDPERSGDFIVLLKEHVSPLPVPMPGINATHGSPWGYDRRVPILFWWKGMAGFEQPNAIETVDIMPTLASLIDLPVPAAEIDGRCVDVIAGQLSNCR
jgi:predicted AlkP superfamily pyrophosphatase or phosphodiesterase